MNRHDQQKTYPYGVVSPGFEPPPSINGRPLRPAVCSCAQGCRSRDEMRHQHGDPERFLGALTNAFEAGMISFDEAERANLKYRAEWREAPEHTQVDKP